MTHSTPLSDAEKQRRAAATRDARHSHRIEGLTIPAKAQAIMARHDAGEDLSADAMVREFLADSRT
jgi:Antitoxin VbhA